MVGLEDSSDQKVETYSKGMKVRLNFIRAIMHDPEILFFDEPTAGLDPVNGHKIKDHMLTLRDKGKTLFVTTHDMFTADEICDRVSFIVDGEIKVTERPSVLKRQYGKKVVNVELAGERRATFSLTNLGNNSDFVAFIKNQDVVRINTMEATLEEVFIKITGKSLQT
jgi:fluoroquinolone transport system ATP-binding protein